MSEVNKLTSSQADQVTELLSKIYSSHSILEEGSESLSEKLQSGQYVSLGILDKRDGLVAHAGFYVGRNFALINSLAVESRHRSTGLGREIFDARLKYIKSNYPVNFIAGYAMAQHLGSQRLYGPEFVPIGLDIGYPDIYHGADVNHNRGTAGNAEVVLCQTILPPEEPPVIHLDTKFRYLASSIFDDLGVEVEYQTKDSEVLDVDSIFLGFHPNLVNGLFTPAYLGRTALVDFSLISTSDSGRRSFVDKLRLQL